MVLGGIGKKHFEMAARWIPSAVTYGGTAGLAVLYFTEWKLILQYLPYYNGRYQKK